ncbi:MAG TPA: NADH:ubiquinone reductase (Na(+)-transporting) subunit B, partial [Flavobacteriales bacterium]|nr:NADH:ubiquinone reductase (Na(+)-transporting) subunit B [Flavobacteriales bacterium]
MKLFRNLLDKIKPNFEKGGKFEKLHPVYDAIETFLFVPNHTTPAKGAQIRDAIDLKRTMVTVIIAMIPAMLFGMWNVGYQHFKAIGEEADLLTNFLYGLKEVLPLIIVSYAAGLTVEFIFASINNHSVNEGFLVSGLLIPLILPIGVPLWMVAVATIFAVLIGKEVFGGTGMNILNVALTARAFLFFAYPSFMSGDKVWINTEGGQLVDGFSGATALGDAASKMPIDTFTQKYSMMESFIGTIPGSIGETSAAAILIGAFILLFTGIASWRVMLSVFAGGYVMAIIFNGFADVLPDNTLFQIPALQHLLIGGFLFGAVFMATDPVTAAQTDIGKYIYGFLVGLFAIMIRVFNPAYPEGMMLAILFMNVFAPL